MVPRNNNKDFFKFKLESSHSLPAAEVITKLQELTKGLFYLSEADYPVEVVHYPVPTPELLTEKDVLALTGSSGNQPVATTDVASFFRNVTVTNPQNLPAKAESASDVITSLRTFCEQHLQNTKVYLLGSRTILALLLGKTPEGQLLGLKTTIIQT